MQGIEDPLLKDEVSFLQIGEPKYDTFFEKSARIHADLIVSKAFVETAKEEARKGNVTGSVGSTVEVANYLRSTITNANQLIREADSLRISAQKDFSGIYARTLPPAWTPSQNRSRTWSPQ